MVFFLTKDIFIVTLYWDFISSGCSQFGCDEKQTVRRFIERISTQRAYKLRIAIRSRVITDSIKMLIVGFFYNPTCINLKVIGSIEVLKQTGRKIIKPMIKMIDWNVMNDSTVVPPIFRG